MAATRSRAERFDSSYRSLRVYWPTRWRLQVCARSDRRAGLPVGLTAHTTPVIRDLLARRDDVCERERARYLTVTEPLGARLAELAAELPALERRLDECIREALEAALAPTEAQLTTRRVGEQDQPELLVRQRRLTEHRRAAEAAKSAEAEAQRQLDRALVERDHLEAQRRRLFDLARSRVLRYGDHTDRLIAVYRQALARRHPERDALVQQWQTDPITPPAWGSADDVVPSFRPTGVAA